MQETITLGKVASAIQVLEQIKRKKPSFKIDYWAMSNIKLLADSYNFFIQKREEIFEKYCKKETDESGISAYYSSTPDGVIKFHFKENINADEFSRAFNDLMQIPLDENLKLFKLSQDAINASTFSLDSEDDIFSIDFLLSE